MSQGAFVTLVGFVAQDPRLRATKSGRHVTDVRVGITPRFRDSTTGEWRDGQTSYYTVDCWQRLADHARASLHKGDPVLIKGRLRTHIYEDRNGQPKFDVRITADTLGHDLSRGTANYLRVRHSYADAEGDPARGQAQGSPGLDEEAEGMIDEDAIERFGRDLDEADLAGRALAEAEAEAEEAEEAEDNEEDEHNGDNDGEDEDEAAEGAEPPISATSF